MTGIDKQLRMQEFAHATARVIIASYFAAKTIGLIFDPTGMEQFLAASNVPSYLLWPNAGFEFLAAVAIMVGFQTRTASALLELYLFWSSFILNYHPNDPYAIGAFWRDLALIGGLLLLFSHGRGRYELDNLINRDLDDDIYELEDNDEAVAPSQA
ncbi:MAG: DoxX family protein [Alphaproteobacteria bacterium]|nr:DoxX family protein [Alphaproteobacteria bacterium]